MLGSYNIYNALAAIGVGLRYNCSASAIQTGLSTTVVPGRFERVGANGNSDLDFAVIVDYAHTPDGLENVLTAARGISDGKLISVFGCGGDRDSGKRPKMGAISTQICRYECNHFRQSHEPKIPMKSYQILCQIYHMMQHLSVFQRDTLQFKTLFFKQIQGMSL